MFLWPESRTTATQARCVKCQRGVKKRRSQSLKTTSWHLQIAHLVWQTTAKLYGFTFIVVHIILNWLWILNNFNHHLVMWIAVELTSTDWLLKVLVLNVSLWRPISHLVRSTTVTLNNMQDAQKGVTHFDDHLQPCYRHYTVKPTWSEDCGRHVCVCLSTVASFCVWKLLLRLVVKNSVCVWVCVLKFLCVCLLAGQHSHFSRCSDARPSSSADGCGLQGLMGVSEPYRAWMEVRGGTSGWITPLIPPTI